MQIYILGRERDLCLAELISLFGDAKLLNENVALVDNANKYNFSRLGGSIKSGVVINKSVANIKKLESIISDFIINQQPSSKYNFGLSYYGYGKINLAASGARIKKVLQKAGINSRLVLPKSGNELNAASLKHNKLTSKGAEFLIAQTDSGIVIARTSDFQDIDSYSKRDYEKPCRDRRVGMLPPKLSQIMINLANPDARETIVDPFCGSGGLLMEAALMGYDCEGSDISQEMIRCSKRNIEWFIQNFNIKQQVIIDEAQDASKRAYPNKPYSIVTEGYLGENFINTPTKDRITQQLPLLRELYIKFFSQLVALKNQPNTICICMPFWKLPKETIKLNLIDEISDLGYTICKFKSVRQDKLYYHREGQFTGRQIIVFKIRKEQVHVKD